MRELLTGWLSRRDDEAAPNSGIYIDATGPGVEVALRLPVQVRTSMGWRSMWLFLPLTLSRGAESVSTLNSAPWPGNGGSNG